MFIIIVLILIHVNCLLIMWALLCVFILFIYLFWGYFVVLEFFLQVTLFLECAYRPACIGMCGLYCSFGGYECSISERSRFTGAMI